MDDKVVASVQLPPQQLLHKMHLPLLLLLLGPRPLQSPHHLLPQVPQVQPLQGRSFRGSLNCILSCAVLVQQRHLRI